MAMTFEVFLMGLLIVSVLTGLFTEAIKKWLQEREKDYYPNALAGYVSVVLSGLPCHIQPLHITTKATQGQ